MILSDEEIYDLVAELRSQYKGNPRVQLEHSTVWLVCHAEGQCHGEYCTMHNRSNHSMRSFPQNWRPDRGIMERICEHGVGHVDPDEITDDRTHGCDGCCYDGTYQTDNFGNSADNTPKDSLMDPLTIDKTINMLIEEGLEY